MSGVFEDLFFNWNNLASLLKLGTNTLFHFISFTKFLQKSIIPCDFLPISKYRISAFIRNKKNKTFQRNRFIVQLLHVQVGSYVLSQPLLAQPITRQLF